MCVYGGGGFVTNSCLNFVTSWTVAHQAPLCMGYPRQEYWSGLPFPSPGDLPNPRDQTWVSCLAPDSSPTELWGNPLCMYEVFYTWLSVWIISLHWLPKKVFSFRKAERDTSETLTGRECARGCGKVCGEGLCALSHRTASKVENGKRSCL